ncbi:MAG: flagellar biosynthetic protein FliO [Oscillospiraceae bacterium]|jgi:flagellar protein FliO/FliZ|nr:flagellar biosynthetic protein FliO [Oscillospiraceae bacterium]
MVLSLTGVIGLILFMFFMLRKVNKHSRAASGSRLRILDRAITGRDSSLLVVSVSGRLMLVGVSAGRIEKLCDLDISEDDYFGEIGEASAQGVKFSDVLNNFMNFGAKKRELTDKTPEGEGEENTLEPDKK